MLSCSLCADIALHSQTLPGKHIRFHWCGALASSTTTVTASMVLRHKAAALETALWFSVIHQRMAKK